MELYRVTASDLEAQKKTSDEKDEVIKTLQSLLKVELDKSRLSMCHPSHIGPSTDNVSKDTDYTVTRDAKGNTSTITLNDNIERSLFQLRPCQLVSSSPDSTTSLAEEPDRHVSKRRKVTVKHSPNPSSSSHPKHRPVTAPQAAALLVRFPALMNAYVNLNAIAMDARTTAVKRKRARRG